MTTGFVADRGESHGDELNRRAALMYESARRAAWREATQIVHLPQSEMPGGAVGFFTAHDDKWRREIWIAQGLSPVNAAITLAHEVGHRHDPALNTSRMAAFYTRHQDSCEAVAHYSSLLVARGYGLLDYLPQGCIEDMIEQHWPMDRLLADDSMVHRADVGALQMLPSPQHEELRAQRAAEGRPLSGVVGWQRVKERWQRRNDIAKPTADGPLRDAPSLIPDAAGSGSGAGEEALESDHVSIAATRAAFVHTASGRCGEWMPRSRQRCNRVRGHNGPCRSR